MRELSKVFKALGDETRLRILKLLEVKELCVCEVEQALEIAQSRASRHLGILREAGLVTDRREGPWVVYRLSDDASPEVQAALSSVHAWTDSPVVEADRSRLGGSQRVCPARTRPSGQAAASAAQQG